MIIVFGSGSGSGQGAGWRGMGHQYGKCRSADDQQGWLAAWPESKAERTAPQTAINLVDDRWGPVASRADAWSGAADYLKDYGGFSSKQKKERGGF